MKVCLNYFNNYPENIPSCPVCSSKAIRPEDGALPVKILLAGRYRLNGLMSTGIAGFSYIADDELLGEKAVIREYFPNGGAIRSDVNVVLS